MEVVREGNDSSSAAGIVPWEGFFLAATLAGLAVGGVAYLAGAHGGASLVWALTTGLGAVVAAWWVTDGLRHGRLGVDLIALLALCGALIVHEELAGAVISVMLATGRSLEAWAAGRARRELRTLLERAPRQAHRFRATTCETVAVDVVVPGDRILVRPGEVVPARRHGGRRRRGGRRVRADGRAVAGRTSERGRGAQRGRERRWPLRPTRHHQRGAKHLRRDRSTRPGGPGLDTALRPTRRSLCRVVPRPHSGHGGFGVGDLGRVVAAVAVLVVATPCPLILAAPVAFVSGLSRSAQRGVIVKGGGTLERLARCRTLLFDKTGTLTAGRPTLSAVVCTATAHPTTCCAGPPRWIRSLPMSWPRRSCGPRARPPHFVAPVGGRRGPGPRGARPRRWP